VSLLDAQREIVGEQIDLLQGTLDMLILKVSCRAFARMIRLCFWPCLYFCL
jgi:hypothetical protein